MDKKYILQRLLLTILFIALTIAVAKTAMSILKDGVNLQNLTVLALLYTCSWLGGRLSGKVKRTYEEKSENK